MLETEIKKLTAAIEANTAALLGGEAPAAKPKPKAKPAAKPSADPAAAEEPPAEEPPADVTLKQVTEKVLELGKQKGRQAAVTLLAEYDAAKVPDLKKDPSKYGEIVAKIDALLAA